MAAPDVKPQSSRPGSANSRRSDIAGDASARVRRPRADAEEIKRVARLHYQELLAFLRSHLAKNQAGPRSNAREKLTRLSKQQFTELSTDVYDELLRRVHNVRSGQEMPHLAVREEFHPKRNQARQKLSTLPKTRFKDLASDVFFELERRFPELKHEFRPEAIEQEKRQAEAIAAAAIAPQPSTSDVIIPAKSTLVEEEISVPYTNGVGRGTADEEEERRKASRVLSGGAFSQRSRDSISSLPRGENSNDYRNTMFSQASSVGTGFINGYAGSRPSESIGGASPNLSRGTETNNSAQFGIEKMRSDYEFRLATLQQRVASLETQKAEMLEALQKQQEQATQLEEEAKRRGEVEQALEEQRENHNRTVESLRQERDEHRERHAQQHADLQSTLSRLSDLERQHAELQHQRETEGSHGTREELEALQREHSQQEELVQELKGEVSSLLEELRMLSERNDSMLADKESDTNIIRDLNSQVQAYKRKYEAAKLELRNLKGSSQLFVHQPKASFEAASGDEGAIADVHLTAFQTSIDELVAAARSKTPSNVMLALKAVILATSLVTDDVSKYEATKEIASEDKEQLGALKTRTSQALNNLMSACRNHASSQGISPVSLLDAAASHVSTTVVDLVKLLKIRKANKAEADEFESSFAAGTLANGLRPLHINAVGSVKEAPLFSPTTPSGTPHADDRLNPTSAGVEGRFSPRVRNGSAVGRYSPVGYRPDISRKNSAGEGSWKADRQRTTSISSSSSAAAGAVPAVPDLAAALRQATLNGHDPNGNGAGANSSTDSSGLDRMPSLVSSPSMQSANGTAARPDPEEDWAELRIYIEKQTELIVHSIQSLLSAIREGRSAQELNEHLTSITTIVASIVAISRENLPSNSQAEGDKVLSELMANTDKLSDMSHTQTTSFDKKEKSLIASASYGIAKGLKRLTELLMLNSDLR